MNLNSFLKTTAMNSLKFKLHAIFVIKFVNNIHNNFNFSYKNIPMVLVQILTPFISKYI